MVLLTESRALPRWDSLGASGASPGHWAEAGDRAVAADSSGSAGGRPLRALRVSPWGPGRGCGVGPCRPRGQGFCRGRPGARPPPSLPPRGGCGGAGPGAHGRTAQSGRAAPGRTWMLPWPPRPSPRTPPHSGDPARPFLTLLPHTPAFSFLPRCQAAHAMDPWLPSSNKARVSVPAAPARGPCV